MHGYAETEVFSPDVMKAREMIESGAIGDVLSVRAREAHSGPHAEHFWNAELAGGGALLDMGCPRSRSRRYFFGKDVPVTQAFAWGATLTHGDKTTGEDNAVAMLKFANGGISITEASWSAKGGMELRNEVMGTEGRLITDSTDTPVWGFIGKPAGYLMEKADADTGFVYPIPDEARTTATHEELRHFVECFLTGRAARDVRRRLRGQRDPRRLLPLDEERSVGADRARSRGDRVTQTATATGFLPAASELLERLADTQEDALEAAAGLCAEAIGAGGLVHVFGTGHSRIAAEELFPRYGSYPGFHPLVELSMTFHTQVVGANGQRQAMFIERVEGLAEAILSNFELHPPDVMIVFSAGGTTAVPIEMAMGARTRGLPVVAVTAVEASRRAGPGTRPEPACSTTPTWCSTSAHPRATRSWRSRGSTRPSDRARPSPLWRWPTSSR